MKYQRMLMLCIAILCTPAMAAEKNRDTHENLNSVLWMQTSAEYQMITTAAFRNAKQAVNAAMIDPHWTAAIEQQGKSYSNLPPAIVVDIDETILDNSRAQAQTVKDRDIYDTTEKKWNEWVDLVSATPIPGSLEFLHWAIWQHPQITVFYLTNRAAAVETKTRENLKKFGYPLKESVDVVMTKGEGPQDSWDKPARRAKLAESYRIILLVGDDLGDFLSGKGSPEERVKAALNYQMYWGERWVILPNPTYGSWERALYPPGACDTKILKAKFEKLNTLKNLTTSP